MRYFHAGRDGLPLPRGRLFHEMDDDEDDNELNDDDRHGWSRLSAG